LKLITILFNLTNVNEDDDDVGDDEKEFSYALHLSV
jgi:hypothetical protein